MDFQSVERWIEAHPVEALVLGGAGVLVLLWLLGSFSAPASSSNSGGSANLAAAYYAAEASQATTAAQIQIAQDSYTASTAQAAAYDNANVAIAQANDNAAMTINGQNASAYTVVNGQNVGLAGQQSSDQLLATYSNNATALATVQSNNANAFAINQDNNQTMIQNAVYGSIVPQELAMFGSAAGDFAGGAHFSVASSGWTPNAAAAAGYSPAQVASVPL